MNDFYIILTASLVAINCALMGSFLVMRKMVMIGDAISHAVLPGIFIAYMVSGSTASLPILIGASVSGIIATILIEILTKKARLQNDASIGITYTLLFAIGVILISKFGQNADLDQQCVLYGEIEYVPLWMKSVFGLFQLPHQTIILMSVSVILISGVIWGFKGLFITTFDNNYASSIGVFTAFWHYFLMSGVSLTTVVSFESVGAILVIAFLSGPPAIAYLLIDNYQPLLRQLNETSLGKTALGKRYIDYLARFNDLKIMILLACIIGIISSILGFYLAKYFDVSIAGSISTAIGIVFILVFVLKQVLKRKVDVITA